MRDIEDLPGDLGYHQVDVILVGRGEEDVGPFQLGLFQHGHLRGIALNPKAAEIR